MNKVILIGNLTKNPELATTPNGKSVCKFGLAVSRKVANANGDRETDFFNVTVWGATGENCNKYLVKGRKIGLVGRIELRNYEDKNGVKKLACDIIAEEVEFLTPAEGSSPSDIPPVTPKKKLDELKEPDEELPF